MDGITFFGNTDQGNKREKNEDSLWPPAGTTTHPYAGHPLGQLFVVADGMGGYGAGNIASQITVNTVQQVYYSADTPGDTPTERLRAAITAAHEQIKIEAAASESRARMGTTVVAVVILNQQLWGAWVGDSRAYLLRQSQLRQLTEDHSVLWEQIQAGLISWEALHYHPQRSRLNNSLTARRDEVHPSFLEAIPLRPDDQLLLCSDGLSSEVPNSDIEEILRAFPPDECALALTDAANSPKTWLKEGEPVQTDGGEDNVTVVVIHMPEARVDPAAAPPPGQTQPMAFHPGPVAAAAPAAAPVSAVTPPDSTAVIAPVPAASAPPPTGGSSLKWVALALVGVVAVALILAAAGLFLFQAAAPPATPAPTAEAAPAGDSAASVDVALGDAIPTSTPALASPTPEPTPFEPTAAPAAQDELPRATSTLAASPTPVPTVTPTPTPPPTATATPTATETTTPAPGAPVPPESKQLLSPPNGKVFAVGTSTIQFVWQLGNNCDLPSSLGFELRIWKEGNAPVGAMDAVAQQKDVLCEEGVYSYIVGDLQSAPGVNGLTEGTFLWDVLLLNIDPYVDAPRGRDSLVRSFGLGAGAERVPTPTPFTTGPLLTATVTLTATGTVTTGTSSP